MRKNKLSILFTLAMLFGLTGCGEQQQQHVHSYDYDNLTWTWTKLSDGGYSATSSAKCKGCENLISQNATVTSKVVSESTCLEKGVISYTAKTIFDGNEYTDIKSEFLQLADHVYGETAYTWNEDYSKCTAHRECSVCRNRQECEGIIENQVITEATCEHSGISNIKATFDVSWAQTQYSTEKIIPQKAHEYGEDLKCKSCKKTLKELNGLSDASEKDAERTPTLSYYGQGEFEFSNNHTFVSCDFAKKDDFELIYNYKYNAKTSGGDSYYSIYIFNSRNESGLIIQVNTNRTSGGSDVYIYRNASATPSTISGAAYKGDIKYKDLPTNRHEDGHYYFPFKSNLVSDTQEDTNVMQIKGTLINEATNEYNIVIKTGGSYENLSQLTTDYNFGTPENEITLKVTLGATYFDSLKYPCFRFSKSQADFVHASDYVETYENREVIYKDLNEKVYAKKSYSSDDKIIAPVVNKEGYKFIGWYDQFGNDIDEILENGKYILAPRFIKNVEENHIRQTLSDFEFAGKDTSKWVGDWGSSEHISTYGIKGATEDTKIVETIFKFRYQSTSDDLYPIFGFTYDGVDESARVKTRIDLLNSRNDFRGFIYGEKTSLGQAGNTNKYEDSNFQMANDCAYILSIQIVKNDSNFTINVGIQSLGSGLTAKVSKDFTFNSTSIVDFTNSELTKMCINSAIYSPMVRDAY